MKGEMILEKESLSLKGAKVFLAKIHDDLQAFLEKNNMIEDYEMYPAEDVVYIMLRDFYNSEECLELCTIVHRFQLTDLAEYKSVDWWFLSSLAFDVDIDKVRGIIEKKMAEEEKIKINSIVVSEEDVSIRKRI
ncbi:hypothetical protein IAE30_25190 [Pantoea sp. S61]|uniref:hypothetical protein n=1 Tax=Pantoea sp. S61 TaxID=2767442 RepID=UPI00190D5B7F|nr:hypothetical protein [Pantoea sp. S61]MBK0127041.1 hypothetical protein [Pantoea sp. S61]